MPGRRPKRPSRCRKRRRNTISDFDATPVDPAGRQLIQGYGDGLFRIAGGVHQGSVLLWPERRQPWVVTRAAEITIESLTPVLEAPEATEILIVGCGAVFVAPPRDLRNDLRESGLVLEWMDTGAACRTFNVLLAEGRPVAAAILAVPEPIRS